MAPIKLNLSGVRGDAFLLDIPLQKPGATEGTRAPLTVAEATTLRDLYSSIRMQVRVDGVVVLDASKAAGELLIDPASTAGPVLSLRIPATKTQLELSGVYDMEFDFAGSAGPLTWIGGKFELKSDVTRAAG